MAKEIKRFIGYFGWFDSDVLNQTINVNPNTIVDYEINYAFSIHSCSNGKGCVLEHHIPISCLSFVCVFVVSQISYKIQSLLCKCYQSHRR